MMPSFIDRTGVRYGRWVLGSYAGSSMWNCVCDCGAKRAVPTRDMVAGKSTSCGCYLRETRHTYNRTHGLSETRTYNIWLGMRQRCRNQKSERYLLYGGRGIVICARWSTFENFYADMGEAPEGLSVDRIDNNKGYSPDNCRWATQREQVNNSRATKLSAEAVYAIRRDTRPLKVIAAEYGVSHTYVCGIRQGKQRSII